MRGVVGVRLATVLAVFAGGLTPPVIHEPFTALPCPIHPDTTIDVEGCQEMRVLRTDRAIDGQVKTIFGLLKTKTARASFVAGEQNWLSYRRSSCTAEASFYGRGTQEPVAYLSCTLVRNKSHLSDLAAMKTTLSQH
jgi:uncharacterized protein YecT (DUF1311 family)